MTKNYFKYAQDVINGNVVCCEYVKLAAERFFFLMENDKYEFFNIVTDKREEQILEILINYLIEDPSEEVVEHDSYLGKCRNAISLLLSDLQEKMETYLQYSFEHIESEVVGKDCINADGDRVCTIGLYEPKEILTIDDEFYDADDEIVLSVNKTNSRSNLKNLYIENKERIL